MSSSDKYATTEMTITRGDRLRADHKEGRHGQLKNPFCTLCAPLFMAQGKGATK